MHPAGPRAMLPGAGGSSRSPSMTTDSPPAPSPPLGEAELVQLRVRVIALESLVIALLAESAGDRLDRVLDMARHISPREGYTAHPVTLQAAEEIRSMVDRARRFAAG